LTANYELLHSGLKETATGLDTLNSQTQAQKQQVQSILSQLEAIRAQSNRDRAALDARFKKLDIRLLDVEREVPTR
jgi:hypothetical protein